MVGVNEVTLVGNVGGKPKVKITRDGKKIVLLLVATTEKWTDTEGKNQEATEWHRVSLFGSAGEIAEQHVRSGTCVYVRGQIHTRKFKVENGGDGHSTEIIVNNNWGRLIALDRKADQQSDAGEVYGGFIDNEAW